jgi:hypothetical protein
MKMKHTLKLSASLCLLALTLNACTPLAQTLPTPNSSATASPMSSASPSTSPSATPSVNPNHTYALPLKVMSNGECQMGDQLRYEVLADGRFSFQADPTAPQQPGNTPEGLQVRLLSTTDLQDLNNLIQSIDLASQHANSKPIPEDAPQTLECRTVQNFSLQVSGKSETYDLNGRKFTHTEAYRNALTQLEQKLESLAQRYQTLGKQFYSLPLKVLVAKECDMGSYPRYSISDMGEFSWALENAQTLVAGPPPQQSRQLNSAEIAEVNAALNHTALLGHLLASEVIPSDAPQTEECRSIEKLELTVNGLLYSLESKGTRKYRLNENYLSGYEELQSLLARLAK